MRDFPLFTTENGVASLFFKEIPYRGVAYIQLQQARDPEKLTEECVGFARAAGAQTVYGSGHAFLEQYPLHTHIYRMCIPRQSIPETDAALMPVTEETSAHFRQIYNEKMAPVLNASYMEKKDMAQVLADRSGYFIHKDGTLLGIAIGQGDTIAAIAAVLPGSGHILVSAINHALTGEVIQLQVASANLRAILLYEKLGFLKTGIVSSWYKIFEDVK